MSVKHDKLFVVFMDQNVINGRMFFVGLLWVYEISDNNTFQPQFEKIDLLTWAPSKDPDVSGTGL